MIFFIMYLSEVACQVGQTQLKVGNEPWSTLDSHRFWMSPNFTTVEGQVIPADLYLALLFGLATNATGAATAFGFRTTDIDVCNVQTFWPMSAAQTTANNMIAMVFMILGFHCAGSMYSPLMSMQYLMRYGPAGFIGVIMFADTNFKAWSWGAPFSFDDFSERSLVAQMPIIFMGGWGDAVNIDVVMFMGRALQTQQPLMARMDGFGDFLIERPGVQAAYYILGACNIATFLFAAYVLRKQVQSGGLFQMSVFICFVEGMAVHVACAVRNIWLTAYLFPLPFSCMYMWVNPGTPETVSNFSSLMMCTVYLKVILQALGVPLSPTASRMVTGVIFLIASACFVVSFNAMVYATSVSGGWNSLRILESTGLLDFAGVPEWVLSVTGSQVLQKQTMLAVFSTVVAIFTILTIVLGVTILRVLSKASGSGGGAKSAKHFLKWMIPNTVFSLANLFIVAFISANPKLDISLTDATFKMVGDILGGFLQIGASSSQVGDRKSVV